MYNIEYICMYVCIDIITTTATTAATEKALPIFFMKLWYFPLQHFHSILN